MALGSLGSLVVNLGLNAVEFTQGLTKAEFELQKLNRSVAGFASTAKTAFELVGISVGIASIVAFSKHTIEAAESLRNLATDTGSSVEELSRLSNIAKISGTSFETFQTSLLRLSAGLSGTEELSSKTAEALKFLGITSKDPASALQEIATKLNKFADGASKAAFARDVFGKSGAAFLSTLKDIAETTDQVNTLTHKQADEAEALAKQMRSLAVNSTAVRDAFLNDVVPALGQFTSELSKAIKETGGLFSALGLLAGVKFGSSIGDQIRDINERIEKQREIIAKGGDAPLFSRLVGGDEKANKRSVDLAIEEINRLERARKVAKETQLESVGSLNDPANRDARDIRFGKKPDLGYVSGAGKDAEALLKKILDGQLRDLDAAIAREKDELNARADFLRDYFSLGYSSVADHYGDLQKARDEELDHVLAFYDQKIDAERRYQALAAKPSERQDAANKIADFQEKQAKAIRDAGYETAKTQREQDRAAQDYLDTLSEISAKLKDIAGDTQAAASIRFDVQNRIPINRATASGDTETLKNIAALNRQEQAVLGLNKAQLDYSNTLERVGLATARIDLEQQTGAITEIDAINKRAAAAQKFVATLTAEVDQYERAARTMEAGPAKIQALLNVDKFRLQIDQLAAATDALARKFDDIFAGAFADAFTDVITGTKSVADAFKDMERQIVQSISRIAAQNIAETIFGKGTAGGGIGELFAKLFGAGASSGGGGVPIEALLGSLAGFAIGGDPPLNRPSIVGENGPELFIPKTAGTIVPNSELQARRAKRGADQNITLNINVMPGATRASADQAAAAATRELLRAQSRLS